MYIIGAPHWIHTGRHLVPSLLLLFWTPCTHSQLHPFCTHSELHSQFLVATPNFGSTNLNWLVSRLETRWRWVYIQIFVGVHVLLKPWNVPSLITYGIFSSLNCWRDTDINLRQDYSAIGKVCFASQRDLLIGTYSESGRPKVSLLQTCYLPMRNFGNWYLSHIAICEFRAANYVCDVKGRRKVDTT